MIGLLPISKIITTVAVVYAFFLLLFFSLEISFDEESWSILKIISYAFSGGTVLQLFLVGLFCFGWRLLWRRFPVLSESLYPDIAGKWDMVIDWNNPQEKLNGTVNAGATIRQNFVKISMEVASDNSASQTLIAQPKKDPESGTAQLYYVYLVTPKAIGKGSRSPYFGAAKLIFSEDNGGELSGNYWTSNQTEGYFRLNRKK